MPALTRNTRGEVTTIRAALAVYILCFSAGALNHLRSFLRSGWRPYRRAPPPLEAFWSALLPLDLLVAALLLAGRRRTGLVLAAAVMVSDVAANSYAVLCLDAPPSWALVCQAAFLGFVLGAAGFLWPRRGAGDGNRTRITSLEG